jgi:hypothetical protein
LTASFCPPGRLSASTPASCIAIMKSLGRKSRLSDRKGGLEEIDLSWTASSLPLAVAQEYAWAGILDGWR